MSKREPRIGDTVTIHATLCEWDGVTGRIVGIRENKDDDMPYMVERSDYFQWPFSLHELELHSLEDEVYEGGWSQP